jgi:hypothetical protein
MNKYENLNVNELRVLIVHYSSKLHTAAHGTDDISISSLAKTLGELGKMLSGLASKTDRAPEQVSGGVMLFGGTEHG